MTAKSEVYKIETGVSVQFSFGLSHAPVMLVKTNFLFVNEVTA